MDFHKFDQFNFSNFFTNTQIFYSPNKIVSNRIYSNDFQALISSINASSFFGGQTFINQSAPIRPLKIKYEIGINGGFNQYTTTLNDAPFKVTNWNSTLDVKIENRKKDVLDVAVGWRLGVSAFKNQISSNFNDPFINHSFYADVIWEVTSNWNLELVYDINSFNASLGQEKITFHLLHPKLSYTSNNGKWSTFVKGFDVLNQRKGIFQNGGDNELNLVRFNTLQQYFSIGMKYRSDLKN